MRLSLTRAILSVPALACLLMAPASLTAGESTRPAQRQPEAIRGFDRLPAERRRLLNIALETGRANGWLKYIYGSADPKNGGFDCSGAMYYVLRNAGETPPRTSAQQFVWIRDAGRLTKVPSTVTSLDDPVFARLMPGDLLFWSGTYEPADNRPVPVTHVQMYLGVLRESGKPAMVGASNGRSFQGRSQNGFGIYDFRLPPTGSKSAFVGFGPPPGLRK